MSGFMTKWAVRREFEVSVADVDATGDLAPDAVARWADDVCDAYLSRCPVLTAHANNNGATLSRVLRPTGPIATVDDLTSVVVSASVTEVHPTSFTISLRIRQVGSEDVGPTGARVVVTAESDAHEPIELGNDVRDELIAIEHAARHYN